MKFSSGLFLGLMLGAVVATTVSGWAQLAPVDATLGERLHWQQVDQTLRMQRDLERAEHDLSAPRYRDPCPR